MNDVFNDVICLVNTDSIFTLNYVNVEDLYFWYLLERIVKESVKLLYEYFKENNIMCCQDYVIYFKING